MIARWSFAPVCGFDFWRVIITSPELLIFLFFMITDPKTIPLGAVGRVTFGMLVAVASTLLMAPQTDEFGAKVALLSGLVVICAARPLVDRLVPEPGSASDDLRRFAIRLATDSAAATGFGWRAARIGLGGVAVLAVMAGIVVAGTPARGVVVPNTAEILDRLPSQVDPATLPTITVGQDVTDFDHELAGPGIQEVVLALAQNLELENQALLRHDEAILNAVDHGDRLIEMQGRLQEAIATGTTVIAHYEFDTLHVSLLIPFGRQDGFSLGLAAQGRVIEESYDSAGNLQARQASPLAMTFAVRQATGARWLNVAVLPSPPGG
jgi:hypothetical protein